MLEQTSAWLLSVPYWTPSVIFPLWHGTGHPSVSLWWSHAVMDLSSCCHE